MAFLTGDGVGQPLGVLNAGCTLVKTRATANHIQFADVAGMLAKLLPESFNRAVWYASPSAVIDLMQLTDGSNRAALVQVGGFDGKPQWSLAGRPLYITEKASPLGTKGDLMLVDRKHYTIVDHDAEQDGLGAKRSVIVAYSAETSAALFTKNQSVFAVGIWVDGRPWLDGPITLQDGSTQVSPFVVLN